MPIKDRSVYPKGWKQFSEHIRRERAGNKCEWCGVENGQTGARDRFGDFHAEDAGLHLFGERFDWKMTRIVLTVAHLNAEGGVCDCRPRTGMLCLNPGHVRALCQRCHLGYDLPKHIENRRQTIAARKDAQRGLLA
jgi:hypothetical protein